MIAVKTKYRPQTNNHDTTSGFVMSGRQSTAGDPTKEGFTSKERDTETGLDYFGARLLHAKALAAGTELTR